MEIPNKSKFQPSKKVLELWLATRKYNINIGGTLMPQFFSDTGNAADSKWVLIAAFGEILGLILMIIGGIKHGGIWLIFAIISISLFIIVDLIIAWKLHRNKAKICKINSLELLEDEENAPILENLKLEKEKGKAIDFLLITVLIIIAIAKVFGIFILGVFNGLTIYIPIACIYFIVAYIHINNTGYYFAYKSLEWALKDEFRNEFTQGKLMAEKKDGTISTTKKIEKPLPIQYNPHEIVEITTAESQNKELDGNKIYKYKINALGVLTDDDLINLIHGFDPEHKIAFFKAGRIIQMQDYGISIDLNKLKKS